MPMNPRLLRPLATGRLLLDFAKGADAAYSLRRISSPYSGPVVRVRRSSDSAEQDFSAAEVSGGALAAWVGAGNNGLVATWYDQSGNGFHASQGTAAAQPSIVSAGVLHTVNSRPAILHVGSLDYLQYQGAAFSDGPVSLFAVCIFDSTAGASTILDAATNQSFASSTGLRWDNSLGNYRFGTLSGFTTATFSDATTQLIRSAFANSTARTIFENGTQKAQTAGNAAPTFSGVTQHKVGAVTLSTNQNAAANALKGSLQEVVAWNSDRFAEQAAITDSINQFYSVY